MIELSVRVTVVTLAGVLLVAALAAWLGASSAGIGVLAAGALTVGNFLWLVCHTPRASGQLGERPGLLGWALSAAARFAVVAVAMATLLVSGWVHPLALVGGLTVLPCVLVATGLSSAGPVAGER